MKIQCASDNAVHQFKNPYRYHENVGLMMWAKAQDTWQKTMVNKAVYKEVSRFQNNQ